MSRRRLPILLAVAVAMTIAPTLSGCSVQGLVSQATGGKVDVGGTTLPKGFPSTVPLVSGMVQTAAAFGGSKSKVWNVTIRVSGISVYDQIAAKLEAAGFAAKVQTGTSKDPSRTGIFTNSTYQVLVVVAQIEKGWSANYTVSNVDAAHPSAPPSPVSLPSS